MLPEVFVYRVVVADQRYPVGVYTSEELARSQRSNLLLYLRDQFVFPEDSMLILEVWKTNTILDDSGTAVEVLDSFTL